MKTVTKSPSKSVAGKKRPVESRLPNPVTVALGKSIRRHRDAKGMSQELLADEAEIERSRLSKLENGHINPTVMTLAAICHCLEISLPVLFKGVTATLAPIADGGIPRRANQATLAKTTKKAN
jgi:transcriptional regulator with XRE-family HTH domain